MKKIILIALAALMFVFALSVSAAASVDTITATADGEAVVGESITVDISYDAVKGFGGLAFSVEFDDAALELTAIDTTGAICAIMSTQVADVTDAVAFSYSGLENVTESGKFAELTFTVLEDAPRGETEITVTASEIDGDIFYYDGQDIVNLTVDTVGTSVFIPLRDFESITMTDAEFVYDGTAKSLAIEGELPEGADVNYEGNEQTAVGTYTVKSTVSCDEYNDLVIEKTLKITAAELNITALDISAATYTLDTVYGDDAVELNLADVSVAKVEDAWVATGFVLAGDDAGNYKLVTESFEVEPTEADIVTVTVNGKYEEAGDTTDTYEFFKGQTSAITASAVSTHKFEGWYVDGDKVSSDKEYEFIAETDFEIVAKYEKTSNLAGVVAVIAGSNRKCTVSYNTVAGSRVASQRVNKGDMAKRPDDPTKGSYKFAGWYTDMGYTVEYDFSAAVTKDITLYAKWELADNRIIMTIDSTDASVFGEAAKTDVPPIIENDRTMLPARFVAESLGATVAWDTEARKATIVGNGVTIELIVDSTTAYVNGDAVTLDAPAFIRNDRTYTPVRFIAEALGAKVEWNADARQAIIIK